VYPIQNNQCHASDHHHYATHQEKHSLQCKEHRENVSAIQASMLHIPLLSKRLLMTEVICYTIHFMQVYLGHLCDQGIIYSANIYTFKDFWTLNFLSPLYQKEIFLLNELIFFFNF
jgi:hypothetical protein